MKIQLNQTQKFGERQSPREIRLLELRQSYVYEGLLEGLPTKEMNARKLQAIPALVEKMFPWIPVAPWIIAPEETPIPYERERPYAFGEPSRLPALLCIGRWESFESEPAYDYSTLVVVWFQDEFALPIHEEVLDEIRQLDWEALAHKGEH